MFGTDKDLAPKLGVPVQTIIYHTFKGRVSRIGRGGGFHCMGYQGRAIFYGVYF